MHLRVTEPQYFGHPTASIHGKSSPETNGMKPNDIVKYSRPQAGEEDLRFILLYTSPAIDTIPAKATIQRICDERIKPIETVFLDEVCPI
jgi:hypothetical protein